MLLISEQHSSNVSKRIRVLNPALKLAAEHACRVISLERIAATKTPIETILADTSAIWLHLLDLNLGSADGLRNLFSLAKRQQVPIVVDTDDDYFSDADCGPFDEALAKHVPIMRELLPQADHITVTGSPLRAALQQLGPALSIAPNIADPSEYRARPRASARVRVGFCGGPTHLRDLTAILPAIARLQRHHDFDFVLFGLYDRDIHETAAKARHLSQKQIAAAELADFATFARALTPVRYEHIPSVPYSDFPGVLQQLDLDIGLCPLLDTHFNRCRSALKFYQYAAVGTISLASDVVPYRGECGYLAANTSQDWEDKLGALLEAPRLRDAQLANQQSYWRAHRTWSAVRSIYESVLLPTARPARCAQQP